jgi:hypothetical protein
MLTEISMHLKVVYAKWVSKNTMIIKLKIYEAVKMTTKCFLNHRLPFHYDITIGLKKINIIKMKCVDQMFGQWFKPERIDYKNVA